MKNANISKLESVRKELDALDSRVKELSALRNNLIVELRESGLNVTDIAQYGGVSRAYIHRNILSKT